MKATSEDTKGCRLYNTPVNVWLRSCNRSNANNAWNVNSTGNVNNNNANNANRGCPDCKARAIRAVHSIATPKQYYYREPSARPDGNGGRTTLHGCRDLS